MVIKSATLIFVIACVVAFLTPFVLSKADGGGQADASFRGFPHNFEGNDLSSIGLSEREEFFLEGFPGQVGRFTDGTREIVIRRVTEATRKLHPASDCFAGVGYTITPLPLMLNANESRWSCFTAARGDERLRVCERIADNHGGEWTDVSAWYWSVLGTGTGEWWAYTVAERE